MDHAINAPVHKNNAIDGLNATEKRYLKGKVELIDKLVSDNTSNIGILPSDSKYFFIKLADQCIHILNNEYILNGLKGSTKMKNRESLLKYQ